MRKTARITAALILMIALYAGGIAQTSPSSTPANALPTAGNIAAAELTPDQTVALLIAEVKDLRRLVATQRDERDALQSKLDAERNYSASLERSYAGAEKQIATLDRSIAHLEKAIGTYERTIALVEKQRDDAKAEAKSARKKAAVATIIATVLAALRFL